MKVYKYSGNYDDPLFAELYDQSETYVDDIKLIQRLIAGRRSLSILECFSGTGRILIPLAQDGHIMTGIEMAPAMMARAKARIVRLAKAVEDRITLRLQDALEGNWGSDYDLVILGANAFYELPSAATQEQCIRFAHEALVSGGRLFIDNNDYKGDWGAGPFGREHVVFEGHGEDGTFGRATMTSVRFDEEQRVLHMKRRWYTRGVAGAEEYMEYLGKKHPVTAGEVEGWLRQYGFQILEVFGDRRGSPYAKGSDRAIFWASKE